MTRVWVMSDIHDDVSRHHFGVYAPPLDVEADVLVVAGDISGKLSSQGRDWLEMTRYRTGLPIVVAPGNHDFWRCSLDREIDKFREGLQIDDIHILDGDSVEVAGVRFVGGSLWTDYRVWHDDGWRGQHAALTGLNDFHYIKTGTGDVRPRARPGDFLDIHQRHRAAIGDVLAIPFAGPTVVVTHHAPSPKSLRGGRVQEPLDSAYASDLEDLIVAGGPELWIHGHVHERHDYEIGSTRVVCNPRGYVTWQKRWGVGQIDAENTRFDERLVLEIERRPRAIPDGYTVENGVLVDPYGMPCGPVEAALDELRAEALAALRVRVDPDETPAPSPSR